MGGKVKESGLTEKQEQFCQLYVSKEFFAHGTESYAEAYNIDLSKPGAYNSAKTMAWKLLTNIDILNRINQLLELSGLTDEYVDKQLLFVVTQNADMGSKVSAIREYNKLKKRITDKLDVKLTGDMDITLKLE